MVLLVLVGAGAVRDACAGAPVFWVGPAAPCNFNSLATAIGAVPDGAEIRLANNQSYDDINVSVNDRSLLISGGWADCTDDAAEGVTELVGDPALNLPVLAIGSPATARDVVLRRLHISGGRRSGIELSGHVELRVERSVIDANEAGLGGGIRVDGVSRDDTLLRVSETRIGVVQGVGGNAAGSGGGIACAHATVRLGGSAIAGNHADAEGGGLFLDDCLLYTGLNIYPFDGLGTVALWVAGNTATINGGGVAAMGGSELEFAAPVSPYAIHANQANEGGGVLLRGAGTRLIARGLTLSENVAGARGGAASIRDGAQFTMERLLPMRGGVVVSTGCGLAATCNVVQANRAEENTGGAFYVSEAALTLRQTVLEDNFSNNGSTLLLVGSASRIENSLLRGNDGGGGSGALVRVLDGSSLVLNSSTVAGNAGGSTLIELFSDNGANNLHLRNSIIWQPGTSVLAATPADTVASVCVNAHENASIEALVHEPGFVDAPAGDYRLLATSPNIDACADPFAGPVADLLGRERPTDLAADHGDGDFDRGAYELGDFIFADGFDGAESPFGSDR